MTKTQSSAENFDKICRPVHKIMQLTTAKSSNFCKYMAFHLWANRRPTVNYWRL